MENISKSNGQKVQIFVLQYIDNPTNDTTEYLYYSLEESYLKTANRLFLEALQSENYESQPYNAISTILNSGLMY
ncbi:MAG: hypothetical protein ACTSYU_12780 [Promethearchaeota archaeon]